MPRQSPLRPERGIRDNDHFSRHLTLDRLAELESAGNVEAALKVVGEALIEEPKTPGLHVIAAHLLKSRKKSGVMGVV